MAAINTHICDAFIRKRNRSHRIITTILNVVRGIDISRKEHGRQSKLAQKNAALLMMHFCHGYMRVTKTRVHGRVKESAHNRTKDNPDLNISSYNYKTCEYLLIVCAKINV